MQHIYKIAGLLLVTLILSNCGNVHNKVTTDPGQPLQVKQANPPKISVSSKEQNDDAQKLNERWQKLTEAELSKLMLAKGIEKTTANTVDSIQCKIDVVYGNQALRYFVGYGAGQGHIAINIDLLDPAGKVLYGTQSNADLAVGAFGGDMESTVEKTIRSAVSEFGGKL